MPHLIFAPDLPVERVEVEIAFDVPAGTPKQQVRERYQYEAATKALPRLRLQGYELSWGPGRLRGPLDPVVADGGVLPSAGGLLHDPSRRERDAYALILPFTKRAALLELPPAAELAVMRREIAASTEREMEPVCLV